MPIFITFFNQLSKNDFKYIMASLPRNLIIILISILYFMQQKQIVVLNRYFILIIEIK